VQIHAQNWTVRLWLARAPPVPTIGLANLRHPLVKLRPFIGAYFADLPALTLVGFGWLGCNRQRVGWNEW
jgi:hypothetical protein